MNLKKEFYKGNRGWWLLFTVLTLLESGVNLLLSFILQQLTDVAVDKNMQKLIQLCIICVVTLIVIVITLTAQCYAEAKFVKKAMLQYKNAVFTMLLKKNRKNFNKESSSTYISALTTDTTSIETNYLQGSVRMVSYAVAFVATIIVMLAYNPTLTLAAVLLAFLPVMISVLSSKKMEYAETSVSECHANFVGTIKDMLSGFAVIKSFKAENEIEKIYSNENKYLENSKCKRTIIKGGIGVLSTFGMVVSQIGVFIVGAFLAISGEGVTAGTLIAFVNMMGALMTPISVIPQLWGGRKAAIALIEKMETAVKESTEYKAGEDLKEFKEGIALENLSFGYTDEKDTLQNISLTFEAGKSYAVVGGSGSGKSTMIDLVMGNYENYRGKVYYDQMELKDINADSLYDFISVVQQEVFVFDSTIRDNITMFKEFPDEQVQRAIELAGLSKLVTEKGEDYLCGENGCNLSGGEKQRISIARCLLKKTPILIADEATAALDAKTTYDVMNAVIGMKDLTRIVVTHQLEENLLKKYDEIIVMKNGVIKERGTFDALLEQKDYFYSLYNVAA